MSYPNAYCLKCKTHTETLDRHTVVLQNGARAVNGKCPQCDSEVYQIMGKKKSTQKYGHDNEVAYPDAYCVKCKTNTKALKGHTVILSNDRRALRGICPHCSSEIYKILPKNADYTLPQQQETPSAPMSLAVTRISLDSETKGKWRQYVKEAALVGAIIAAIGAVLVIARMG